MKFKVIVTLLSVVVLISSFAVAANIYINTGKVIPGKITAFDGKELTFILPGANISVNIPVQKIVKISFDEKTENGTGLILKNGINLQYAQLAAVKNGKALFSLPFGALEVNNLSDIAFVNFKNAVDMNVPNPFDFVVHPVTGGEFVAKLTSVQNGLYNFQTIYGDLSIPWSQIKDIKKEGVSTSENGVLLAGNINFGGKITSFDGTYFTLVTSYGQFRIINGSVLYAVNPNPVSGVDFSSFLQLRNGQVIAGSVSSWKNGKINYTTPWGELKFSEDEVAEVKIEKNAGIYVVTTPSNADVQLDGTYIGKTPLKLPVTLSGMHTIVVSKPGYQILEKKIYATPYMVAMLNYGLSYGNIWKKDTPMPTARNSLAAVEYYGKIYAIGGYNGSRLNTVEVYDPKTNTWSKAAPMLTPRYRLATVEYGGKIYAIGGCNSGYLNTVEVYDPKTNTWSHVAPMPTARDDLATVEYDGKIYVIGGYNNSELNTVEVYDPKTNTWSHAAPMPTARWGLATVEYGGKIYAIGGSNGSYLNTVEVYDPKTNMWSHVAPMPTAREGLAAVEYGGKIYAIGGWNNGELSTVEVYDPKTNAWSKAPAMPTAREWLAAVEYGGKVYAIGGNNGNGSLNTVENFIPGIKGKVEIAKSQTVSKTSTVSSTNPKAPTSINAEVVIITPVTVGVFLNEKHDLTLTISNGKYKKTLTKKNVSSAQPVIFEVDKIVAGTYTVVATWGKHTDNWSVDFEDEQTSIRFMMR